MSEAGMNVVGELVMLLVLIVLVMIVPFVLTFFVALWEKRQVWPYEPLEEAPAVSSMPDQHREMANPYAVSSITDGLLLQPTEKAAKANAAAQSLNFKYLGAYRHGGGALYQVRYDAWVSAEHEVLALVGGGKLASVPVDSIWLFTQLASGVVLVTITAHNAAEYDLSGMTSEALVPQASFAQAVVSHLGRMKEQASPGLNYSDNPLADHYQFRLAWSNRLREQGFIRFIDATQTVWRFTLSGALRFAVKAHIVGVTRKLLPSRSK